MLNVWVHPILSALDSVQFLIVFQVSVSVLRCLNVELQRQLFKQIYVMGYSTVHILIFGGNLKGESFNFKGKLKLKFIIGSFKIFLLLLFCLLLDECVFQGGSHIELPPAPPLLILHHQLVVFADHVLFKLQVCRRVEFFDHHAVSYLPSLLFLHLFLEVCVRIIHALRQGPVIRGADCWILKVVWGWWRLKEKLVRGAFLGKTERSVHNCLCILLEETSAWLT